MDTVKANNNLLESLKKAILAQADHWDVEITKEGHIQVTQQFSACAEEEPHDVAWDLYCSMVETIKEILPENWEMCDSYTDHDTVQTGWRERQ